jgi:hypothetical protein
MWLINQTLEIRDMIPEETEQLWRSGYRLCGIERPELKSAYSPDHDKIFKRNDVLDLAKQYELGKGYKYKKVDDGRGGQFYQLHRAPETHGVHRWEDDMTIQYLADRLVLLMFLFDRDQLGLSGRK